MKTVKFDLNKENTKSTANMIINNVKNMGTTELLSSMFISTEDKVTEQLIKNFEKQILLANLDPDRFRKNLYTFYKENSKFIKKNKLQKNIIRFLYYLEKNLFNNGDVHNEEVYRAYSNIVLQQLSILSKQGYKIAGIDNKGDFIYITEPFKDIEIPILIYNQNGDFKQLIANYKKYGYDIKKEMDLKALFENFNLISNSIHMNSFLVNDDNKDMLVREYAELCFGINMPVFKNLEYVDSFMNKRKRFIKGGRVKVLLSAGDIKEIELNELFVENELFVFYKVICNDNKGFNGFMDISNNYFYSIFKEGVGGEFYHYNLENIIKEIYVIATSDIDLTKTRINELNMKFCYKELQFNSKEHKGSNINKRDLDLYDGETVNISSYIRKLPSGAVASEEAKNYAKSYGFELNDNETFVRPFEKTIYKKK